MHARYECTRGTNAREVRMHARYECTRGTNAREVPTPPRVMESGAMERWVPGVPIWDDRPLVGKVELGELCLHIVAPQDQGLCRMPPAAVGVRGDGAACWFLRNQGAGKNQAGRPGRNWHAPFRQLGVFPQRALGQALREETSAVGGQLVVRPAVPAARRLVTVCLPHSSGRVPPLAAPAAPLGAPPAPAARRQ
eukprot:gene22390-biopygen17735